jgi:DNA replication ATP-dependent helicase Dna2
MLLLFYTGNMRVEEQKAHILFQRIKNHLDTAQPAEAKELFTELFTQFLDLATEESGLIFNSFFSKIAYLVHKEDLPPLLTYWIHLARKEVESSAPGALSIPACYAILTKLMEAIWKVYPPEELAGLFQYLPDPPLAEQRTLVQHLSSVRCALLEDLDDRSCWKVLTDGVPDQFFFLSYEDVQGEERLKESLLIIKAMGQYPMVVQAIDVSVTEDNLIIPKALVLEPDYLVDVTTIAKSYVGQSAYPDLQILGKWMGSTHEVSIFVGNLANLMLDLLVDNPRLSYTEALTLCFKHFPLDFTFLSSQDIQTLNQRLKVHFSNLKSMVEEGFPQEGIVTKDALLEPSFYSPIFGIQGRLDLLYQDPQNPEHLSIVELKSGKPFMPNKYGVGNSHYVQILLYDLLIRSAYGLSVRPKSYILYSGLMERPLRTASAEETLQFEALHLRNAILAQERRIAQIYTLEDMEREMHRLSPGQNPKVKGFLTSDLVALESLWKSLDLHEKHYLSVFMGFIAREQLLSKSGIQTLDKSMGQSSLWLESAAQKEARFAILSNLRLIKNAAVEKEPYLIFEKTEKTHALSNLRQGDIAILYPSTLEGAPTQSQLFKGTLVELGAQKIVLRLRAPVYKDRLFEQGSYWHLEPDHMDSAYVAQFRSLFQFFSAPKALRDIVMGWTPPGPPKEQDYNLHPSLSEEQSTLIKALLNSQNYFLLWGPPGTGKTSFVVKYLLDYLLNNTEERILLLAFTNKAVEEVGQAILDLGEYAAQQLVRLGSGSSVSEAHKKYLLNEQTASCDNRLEIREKILSKRIWIGTVASVSGKRDWLLKLGFSRVLIDEASQVLEPMLLGILPLFPHFTLIGDHRQLPAVVAQAPQASFLQDPVFEKLGLKSLHNSLFERLLHQNDKFGKGTQVGKLRAQGRMLPSIMQFASKHFYNDQLQALPFLQSLRYWQKTPHAVPQVTQLREKIYEHSCIFIPVSNQKHKGTKTNPAEAEVVVKLLSLLKAWREDMGEVWTDKTCGVITPYRAQIACIKNTLHQAGWKEEMTIDTVERFQGGARDIIVISLCLNQAFQLNTLVSLSEEGIDRKLNVALTRARRQLFVLGDEKLMQETPFYQALTREFYKLNFEF